MAATPPTSEAAAAAAALAASLDPGLILGPWLLGLLSESVLTGVLLSQVATYFAGHGRYDKRFYQAAVIVLAIASPLMVASVGAVLWRQLVNRESLLEFVIVIVPAYQAVLVAGVVSVTTSQLSFCYRLYEISHKLLVAGPIALVSFTNLVFSIVCIALGTRLPPMAGRQTEGVATFVSYIEIVSWLILAIDILLTAAMTTYLLTNQSGLLHETDTRPERILTIAVTNGSLLVALSLGSAVATRISSEGTLNELTAVFLLSLAPASGCCVMYMLGSREAPLVGRSSKADSAAARASIDLATGQPRKRVAVAHDVALRVDESKEDDGLHDKPSHLNASYLETASLPESV